MIAKLMRTVKKVRPWMVAVALAGGAAWASSCDDGGRTCVPDEPTCTTDEECVARNGPGSYCRTDTVLVPDGCGNLVDWGRICSAVGDADADADADDVAVDADADVPSETPGDADADCVPAVFYGPDPICADDAQCESEFGTGWTCTGYESLPDTCGGTVNWGPFCEPPGGADADADVNDGSDDMVVYYGPPPVDASDTTDIGTFYGPPPVDAGTDSDAGTWYGPPPTDDAGVDDDTPATAYGPIPVDGGGGDADVPGTFYGPIPADGK
ncbi:MAG: hypothetical protein HY905_22435 [Deltaproteobacteria bacterium]|nr:hypothetical protein [Deltaproteobacteria bacterium]